MTYKERWTAKAIAIHTLLRKIWEWGIGVRRLGNMDLFK